MRSTRMRVQSSMAVTPEMGAMNLTSICAWCPGWGSLALPALFVALVALVRGQPAHAQALHIPDEDMSMSWCSRDRGVDSSTSSTIVKVITQIDL